MARLFFCTFSSWSFMGSGLTLKPLIHFQFIFVYSVRQRSSFILLHMTVQFPQPISLKRLSIFHCMFSPYLAQNMGSINLCAYFCATTILFGYYSFVYSVKSWSMIPQLCSLFSRLFQQINY